MIYDKRFEIYFEIDHKNKFELIVQLCNLIGKLKVLGHHGLGLNNIKARHFRFFF